MLGPLNARGWPVAGGYSEWPHAGHSQPPVTSRMDHTALRTARLLSIVEHVVHATILADGFGRMPTSVDNP